MGEKPTYGPPDTIDWGHPLATYRSDRAFHIYVVDRMGDCNEESDDCRTELTEIIRRYNAHDALVEALVAARECVLRYTSDANEQRTLQLCDAALALAKGEDDGKDV